MDVQFKPCRSKVEFKNIFFMIVSAIILTMTSAFAFDFKTKAYQLTVGSEVGISVTREFDLLYTFIDPNCCCVFGILSAFEERSTDIADLINPSTDTLIGVLTLELQDAKLREDQMKNLKIVNGLYSFSDEDNPPPAPITSPPSVPAEGLCRPIDPNNEEDMNWYRDNITDRFESGGNYSAVNCSGAYGRYQMVPRFASKPSNPDRWCQFGGAGCCAETGTYTKMCGGESKVFKSYAWHASTSCQDNMYNKLTSDNINSIANRNYPITSCNMYMVHQQGAGGFSWLMGGRPPYGGNISALQNAVKQNISGSLWASAVASGRTSTADGLREVFKEYWVKKLGADPFTGEGAGSDGASSVGLDGLTSATQIVSSQPREQRDKFRRDGILLELMKEIFNTDVNIRLIESRVNRMLIEAKE